MADELGAAVARELAPLLGDRLAADKAVVALRRYSLVTPARDGSSAYVLADVLRTDRARLQPSPLCFSLASRRRPQRSPLTVGNSAKTACISFWVNAVQPVRCLSEGPKLESTANAPTPAPSN